MQSLIATGQHFRFLVPKKCKVCSVWVPLYKTSPFCLHLFAMRPGSEATTWKNLHCTAALTLGAVYPGSCTCAGFKSLSKSYLIGCGIRLPSFQPWFAVCLVPGSKVCRQGRPRVSPRHWPACEVFYGQCSK